MLFIYVLWVIGHRGGRLFDQRIVGIFAVGRSSSGINLQSKFTREIVIRIIILQTSMVFILGGILGLSFNWHAALSVLLGGSSAILPSLYLAWRLMSSVKVNHPNRIIKAFYWGEIVKILLMTALLIFFIRFFTIEVLPFFCGFIGAQIGVWLYPLLAKR